MNEHLSGIIEEALKYATPLPVQPEVPIQCTTIPKNSQTCDVDFQNEDFPSTEIASTTQLQNVQLLNEFDAYNIGTDDNVCFLDESNGQNLQCVAKPNIASKLDTITKALAVPELPQQHEPYSNIESEVKEDTNALKNLLKTQTKENVKTKRRRGKSKNDKQDVMPPNDNQNTETKPEYAFDKINETKSASIEETSLILEESLNSISTIISPFDSSPLTSEPSPISNTSSQSPLAPSANEPEVKRKRTRRRDVNPDKTPPPQILPPCKICDEKSSGFHYGANTCEACKGFFRRTLKKKEVTFQCKCTEEDKEVWTRGPNKNGCPACRYERCLAVGMSKNAIKIGRYTLDRKTENIKEVKSLEAMDTIIRDAITEATKADSPGSLSDISTPFIEGLQISSSNDSSATCTSMMDTMSETLSPLSALVQSALSEEPPMKKQKNVYDDEIPSTSGACSDVAISLKEIDTLVKTMVDAQEKHDILETKKINVAHIKERQTKCLERYTLKTKLFGKMAAPSIAEFKEFYETTGLDLDGRLEDMKKALAFFESRIAKLVGFAKSIPGFKLLDIDDQASLIKVSRVESTIIGGYEHLLTGLDLEKEVVVTPWGKEYHLNDLDRMLPRELIECRHQLAKTLKEMDLTNEERAVVRGLAVVATDQCELKQPEMAERIQTNLMTCLQHLLSVRPGGPGTKFYKIINFIVRLREFSYKEDKKAKSMYLDWPALYSNFDLLSEFLR